MLLIDDEHYIVHVEPSGVMITRKHAMTQIPGETYILDAAIFTKIADAFREERYKVQVFSNHEALTTAMYLLQSPSALHTTKFVEVLVADGSPQTTGQSYLLVSCSCGKKHAIHTHGDLEKYRSNWNNPVMEGI